MKKKESLPEDAHDTIQGDPISGTAENNITAKVGRHFKKIIYIASLAGLGFCLNACAPAYVATEPAYVEYERPSQPSNQHIWVDGNWVYSRQAHGYVQKNGYWERPNQRRTYVSGHWQTTPRGHYWAPGHWKHRGR